MLIFSNKIYFSLRAQQQRQPQQRLHHALLQSRALPLPSKPPSSLPGRKNQTSLLLHASSPFNTSTSTLPARLCCYFSCSCQRQVYTRPGTDWRTFAPHRYRSRPLSTRPPVYRVPRGTLPLLPLTKPAWKQPGWDLLWSWNVPETAPPLYSPPPQSKETFYVKPQVGSFFFYDANIWLPDTKSVTGKNSSGLKVQFVVVVFFFWYLLSGAGQHTHWVTAANIIGNKCWMLAGLTVCCNGYYNTLKNCLSSGDVEQRGLRRPWSTEQF